MADDYTIDGVMGIPSEEPLGVLTEGLGYPLRPVVPGSAGGADVLFFSMPDAYTVSEDHPYVSTSVNETNYNQYFGDDFGEWMFLEEGQIYVFQRRDIPGAIRPGDYLYTGPQGVWVGYLFGGPAPYYRTQNADFQIGWTPEPGQSVQVFMAAGNTMSATLQERVSSLQDRLTALES